MQKTATIDDIVAMTKDDPERFASSLLGEEPTQRTGMQVRYFDNQSLVVNTGGPSQGRFYNFTDPDAKGDMLDLVRWHRGLSDDKQGRKEAIAVTKSLLGLTCVFHGYVAIESMNMWPRIPRACGHRFHGMWPPL